MKAFLFLIISLVVATVNGSSHRGKELWVCNFEEAEGRTCDVMVVKEEGTFWNRRKYDSRHTGAKHADHGDYYMDLTWGESDVTLSKPLFYLPINYKGEYCVSFYYKVGKGSRLEVITSLHSQGKVVWKKTAQTKDWHHAEVTVNIKYNQHVGFMATVEKSYYTGTAVDIIRVLKGSCH